jgi:hypothetical protein
MKPIRGWWTAFLIRPYNSLAGKTPTYFQVPQFGTSLGLPLTPHSLPHPRRERKQLWKKQSANQGRKEKDRGKDRADQECAEAQFVECSGCFDGRSAGVSVPTTP